MSSDADLAAIRAFVAGGGQFQTDKDGNIVAPISAAPATVVLDADNTPPPAAPAASNASPAAAPSPTPGATAADQAAQQREADRQADRQARLARQAAADQQKRQREAHDKNPLVRFSNALSDWAGNVPTPGGNLALVLLLIFFAFAIIPVNAGKTRLQLIWLVLTGNADLPGALPDGTSSGSNPISDAIAAAAGAAGNVAANAGSAANAVGTGFNLGIGGVLGLPLGSGGGADPAISGVDPLALLEAPRGGW